jgi:hypothetical protein
MATMRSPMRAGGSGLVPGEGFEPSRGCPRLILSQLRLPFRHPGVGARPIVPWGLSRRAAIVAPRAAIVAPRAATAIPVRPSSRPGPPATATPVLPSSRAPGRRPPRRRFCHRRVPRAAGDRHRRLRVRRAGPGRRRLTGRSLAALWPLAPGALSVRIPGRSCACATIRRLAPSRGTATTTGPRSAAAKLPGHPIAVALICPGRRHQLAAYGRHGEHTSRFGAGLALDRRSVL